MKHSNSQEVLCYITTQDYSSLIFNGGGTCQLAPPVRVRACVCVKSYCVPFELYGPLKLLQI